MKKQTLRLTFLFFLFAIAGCKKNEPVPIANFTFYDPAHNFHAPCTVIFTNRSENAFSWSWGYATTDSIFSTDTNTQLTFTADQAGTYSIRLRAYTQDRKEWASVVKSFKIVTP